MPRYHRYKHKPGGYWRGKSRWTGRYYTRKDGCAPLLILLLSIVCLVILISKAEDCGCIS